MSYYKRHLFFCTNKREGGDRPCCADAGAVAMRAYAKKRAKELGITGEGAVRINSAGCLDRCEEGPTIVVYPEGTWYTYVDEEDIDEILEQHVINGRVVDRLTI